LKQRSYLLPTSELGYYRFYLVLVKDPLEIMSTSVDVKLKDFLMVITNLFTVPITMVHHHYNHLSL